MYMQSREMEEKFVTDLQELSSGLDREIAAHDYKANVKRNENIWFILVMKIVAAITMVVSGGAAYTQGDVATAFAWLGVVFGALNFGLTSWYASWAPGDERAQHIIAIGQKSAIQGKVKLQLIAPDSEKQDPVAFYRWIHEQAANVGAASPYLTQTLLAATAKKTQ
jgi:hypothetical protein